MRFGLRKKPHLTTTELKQRLDQGEDLLLLDVRDKDEYHGPQGHVTEAVNVPLNELPQRIDELGKHHERQIAVVCYTAKRSAKAVDLLKEAGFDKVLLVEGGMKQWKENGFPVE